MRHFVRAAAWAVAGSLAVAGPSLATEDFRNRTITVVVPSGSGGTFHIYCQLVQRHLGRHIPGNPETIIQNRPGAGGAKSARFMMTAAPKDGTMIAMINPGTTMTPLLRPGIGYDATEFQWLGAVSVRTYTIATFGDSRTRTMEDAMKRETLLGSTGKSATSTLLPLFLNEVLGTKFKVITGYKGGGAINLAMERGEVEGRTNYYSGYLGVRPHWIENNQLNFLGTIGPARPEVADVPKVRDMVKPGMDREMLDLLEANFNVGQGFYVPPGVPKDVVATLRTAFTAMLKDPKMIAEAEERKVPTWSRTWQEVEAAVRVGYGSRKEVQEKLATALGFRQIN